MFIQFELILKLQVLIMITVENIWLLQLDLKSGNNNIHLSVPYFLGASEQQVPLPTPAPPR